MRLPTHPRRLAVDSTVGLKFSSWELEESRKGKKDGGARSLTCRTKWRCGASPQVSKIHRQPRLTFKLLHFRSAAIKKWGEKIRALAVKSGFRSDSWNRTRLVSLSGRSFGEHRSVSTVLAVLSVPSLRRRGRWVRPWSSEAGDPPSSRAGGRSSASCPDFQNNKNNNQNRTFHLC